MGPSFKKRLLTSLLGIPVVIFILISPTPVVALVVTIASLIGLYEYFKAVGLLAHKSLCTVGYIASLVISAGSYLPIPLVLILAYTFVVAFFLIMLLSNYKISVSDIGLLVLGLFYIPFLLSHITYTRELEYGRYFIWLIFIGAFLTDSCAYFSGCLLGKHKLCPTISPKKTVEGAIGGIIGAGLSFVLYGIIVNYFFTGALGGKQFSLWLLFVLGLISAFASEIGDLVASSIKRQYDIKDFGNCLPGHGGILDRCDSIIFVAPVVFLFLYNISIII